MRFARAVAIRAVVVATDCLYNFKNGRPGNSGNSDCVRIPLELQNIRSGMSGTREIEISTCKLSGANAIRDAERFIIITTGSLGLPMGAIRGVGKSRM